MTYTLDDWDEWERQQEEDEQRQREEDEEEEAERRRQRDDDEWDELQRQQDEDAERRRQEEEEDYHESLRESDGGFSPGPFPSARNIHQSLRCCGDARYQHLLDALADPSSPDHDEAVDRLGAHLHPTKLDRGNRAGQGRPA